MPIIIHFVASLVSPERGGFYVDIIRHIFMESCVCMLTRKDECRYLGSDTALDKSKTLRCIHLSSQTLAVGCHPLPALAQ